MAIQLTIQTPHGLTITDSYVKIQTVGGGKDRAVIELFYYVNQAASKDGLEPLVRTYHDFIPSVAIDADNFIKQGYDHVKTLPEFASAIDC